ncbi:MAG: DUF2092 domain-containing protein [Armatimonadota bacterium]
MRTAKRLVPALALLLLVAFLVQRYLVHPDPGRILARTVALYSSLEFYSDTTTVRSDLDSVQGTYEFAYARPNRLRVQFRGVLGDELVVADGITLYVHRPDLNQYVARPAPRVLADELPGAQPMLKLSLLNGRAPLGGVGTARYEGREKLHGRWVHKVRIKADRPGGGESAASTGSEEAGGPANMVLWVGAEDALIYRSDLAFELGTETVTHSLVSDGISTAPPPAGAFTFEPPPGSRPVARFEAAEVLPDAAGDGIGEMGGSEG